jgi:hypothetical protein
MTRNDLDMPIRPIPLLPLAAAPAAGRKRTA